MNDQYDYIIVGAGSSGCVVANKLSADPANKILLIESGPADKSWLIHMPRGIGKLLGRPGEPHSWYYEASRGGNRPSEPWQKGRTLGGSSSINGMVYVRGHPRDYDRWAEAGCNGWSWAEMKPVFEKMETLHFEGQPASGSGPLHVNIPNKGNALTEAIIAGAGQLGIPRVANNNDAPDGGIGYQPETIWNGRRQSAAKAFLDPVRDRPNLDIVTDVTALQLEFEDNRAKAVTVRHKSGIRSISARREIILSAGAIQSAKMLQLSGIGPAKLLSSLGIPVVRDSRDVGQNLREHLVLPTVFQVREGSLNGRFRGVGLLQSLLRYALFSSGPMAGAIAAMCAYVKSRPDLDRPDIQVGFGLQSVAPTEKGVVVSPIPGITLVSYFMHPESRGSLAIRSTDPDVAPVIDANYLDDPVDRRTALATLRLNRAIAAQPAVAPFILQETVPGPDLVSDDALLDFAGLNGTTGYHVSCTCRMGSDEHSVVDPRLRVRGVQGLRVVDTSIMPDLPSGNTNGPAMAIGWRGAEMILEDAVNS